MSIASLVRRMADAGATPEVIAIAVEALEAMDEKERERKAKRAAQKAAERARKREDGDCRATVAPLSQDSRTTFCDPSPLNDPPPLLPYVEVNLNSSPTPLSLSLSPPKKSASRATPFPEGFAPNATDLKLAAEQGVAEPEVLAEVVDHFRDHHNSKGNVFKDWHAAFRTWLRSPLLHQRPPKPGGPVVNGFHRPVQDFGAMADRIEAEVAKRKAARDALRH